MNNPWWNISYKLYRLRSTQVKEELVLIKQDPICLDESQNNLNHIRWQLRYYVYRLLFISFSLKKAFPVVNKIVHSWLKVFGRISLKAFVSSKWEWLLEKCPYLEIFLVRIFPQIVRIREITDQKAPNTETPYAVLIAALSQLFDFHHR